VFAYPEVIRLCERGLCALDPLPRSPDVSRRELALVTALGIAQMSTLGFAAPEVHRTHERARELCEQLGQRDLLVRVMWRLHTCRVNSGDLLGALRLAEEMRTIADQVGTLNAGVESLHALGTNLGFMGRLEAAREPLERIAALTESQQNTFDTSLYVLDPLVTSSSLLGRLRTMMGQFDLGMEVPIVLTGEPRN
jgi:predicted ATPase